jgi:hypothetical protein
MVEATQSLMRGMLTITRVLPPAKRVMRRVGNKFQRCAEPEEVHSKRKGSLLVRLSGGTLTCQKSLGREDMNASGNEPLVHVDLCLHLVRSKKW